MRVQVGNTNRWRIPAELGSDLLGTSQAMRAVESSKGKRKTISTGDLTIIMDVGNIQKIGGARFRGTLKNKKGHLSKLQSGTFQAHTCRRALGAMPPNEKL